MKHHPSNMHGYACGPSYTGFTLLEVLVTIVIVALGLLGLGALHVRAMRDTTSAYLRSEATILTQDMADRIRANPLCARDCTGAYEITLNDGNKSFDAYKSKTQSAKNCLPAGDKKTCKIKEELAEADKAQWSIAVANRLPGGRAKITPQNVNAWEITVYWDERVDSDKPEANCSNREIGEPELFACLRVRVQP